MGHHYVPQRYLRGFQEPDRPGFIWMSDKLASTSQLLPIKQVAQAPKFYENDVERELAEAVESPGSDVIDKIRESHAIDEQDRMHLTYSIGVMLRRIPHARSKAEKLVPRALDEVLAEVREWIESGASEGKLGGGTVAEKLAEMERIEQRFRKQPPHQVKQKIETPWPTLNMLMLIHNMSWRILRSGGPSYFLTSDNPAYFFEGGGLGNPQCELTLPLCNELLLHCSWQACRETGVQPVEQRLVKVLNSRTASGAARFVFYHREADWILRAASNKVEQLSRIWWQ